MCLTKNLSDDFSPTYRVGELRISKPDWQHWIEFWACATVEVLFYFTLKCDYINEFKFLTYVKEVNLI